MITVKIEINGEILAIKHAHRIAEPDRNGNAQYKTDCNKIIEHNPKDGAVVLSKKMLDLIELQPAFFDLSKEEQYLYIQNKLDIRFRKN